MKSPAPQVIARVRDLVEPALRDAVEQLDDDRMRLIASYQLGWCDAEGNPTVGHAGKAIRPTLAVLSAEAGGGTATDGVAGAVAVELVHNFSLLHDDVMDADLERRHRPTGWAVFGTPHAILAGTAMLTQAVSVLADAGTSPAALTCLLDATQRLISGQSDDVLLEGAPDVELEQVLRMEAGKTAALLACAASIGAVSIGADEQTRAALSDYGHHLGMAFQLVDDVLGITGDPAVTGKSASSDVRAGKRTAPVVAALGSGTGASRRLADLLAGGPPSADEDVALAAKLIDEAGGLEWAARAADEHLSSALAALARVPLPDGPAAELAAVGRYVVTRDR